MENKEQVKKVVSDEKEKNISSITNKDESLKKEVEVNLPDLKKDDGDLSKTKKSPLIFSFSNKDKKDDEIPSVKDSVKEEKVVDKESENVSETKNIKDDSSNDLQMPSLNKAEKDTPVLEAVKYEEAPIKQEETKDVTEVSKSNESNIVQPADFNTIFNVESEEKAVVPASVRLDNDVTKTLNSEVSNSDSNVVDNTNAIKKAETKKEVFNGKERLLYEIKPDKEGNPIVVVLFFILLLGTIVSLPYISKKISFENNNPTTGGVQNEEEQGDIYFFNRSSVRAKLGGLEFTNFVKSKENGEYFLTFNITNTNDRAYQFDGKYYVVFYDGESIVYRALIHTYDVVGSNAAQEVTLTINERGYSSADRFKIEEIPVATYPDVNLIEKDGDFSVLTCNYLNDEVKYYFQDGKLSKLKETYTEKLENSRNYEGTKAAYKNLSNSYKRVNNFTSTFVEANTYFTMINEFTHKDISDATLFNLKTYKFFRYNESKDVVSFELGAQGYTCG